MLIEVWRRTYTPESTQGMMALNGVFECYTLEPRKDQSQGKPYCIPAGKYGYRIGTSAHFGRNVILVDGVSGFENIEIHPGNFPRDTHGCCLTGTTESDNFVGHSEAAFDALMAKLPPVGDISYIDKEEI